MSGLLSVLVPFLIVLGGLVFFHELGHFLVARFFGVGVQAFSIGFGPELLGWNDKHKTRWKISAIPLGGYVKLDGEEGAKGKPSDRDLSSKHPFQKILIAFAGPFANYLLAVIIFFGLLTFQGVQTMSTSISAVRPGSVAEKMGLRLGDRILGVNDQKTISALEVVQGIQDFVTGSEGSSLKISFERDGLPLSLTADIQGKDVEVLGVEFKDSGAWTSVSPLKAMGLAIEKVMFLTKQILKTLTRADAFKEVGGVLMIAKVSGDVAAQSWLALLGMAGVLSISLGLVNLFPIPALDGGHIMLYTFEWIKGGPVSPRFSEWFFRIGMIVVIGLFLLTTVNDLSRLGIVKMVKGLF